MSLEQQLRAALAPCEPGPAPMTVVMARLSRRRWRGRIFIASSALALSAAAAMLAARLVDKPVVQPMAVVPAQHSAPSSAVVADALPPLVSPAPAPETPAPAEATPAVNPFSVSVVLQNKATDAAIPAVDSFYAALLDDLRFVPGLKLIEQDRGGTAPAAAADYRWLVDGTGPLADNKFSIAIAKDPIELPGGGMRGGPVFSTVGDIANPVGLVALVMESVRSRMLPPDPAYKQLLQARLLDSTQDPRQRLKALTDLGSIGRDPAGSDAVSLDSDALRGAIDLATTAADPQVRAQVWRAVRGVRNAELVPSLAASLRSDSSVEVCLEALATLSADFRDDARARTTLESVARDDARPLLRALAQRALTGDSAWRQYIVSSLQDTTRPVAERVEAFAYHMYRMSPSSRSGYSYSVEDARFLDDEMIHALSQALPQAENLPFALSSLASASLLATGKPAGVAVVLRMVKYSTELRSRSSIVNRLTQSSGDPRVREALERISADDPDLELRRIAADVLKSAPPSGQ